MTDNTDTLKLVPAEHGKLGVIHCGVTREGFIAVAGDPRDIADGEEILFQRVAIKALAPRQRVHVYTGKLNSSYSRLVRMSAR